METLANRGFYRKNWTPASILIVSKLVSSYGAPAGTRTPDTLLKRQVLCLLSYWGRLAGMAGLEPTISESKSGVLPLHYIPILWEWLLLKQAGGAGLFYIWGGIWGSNPRHPEPQSGALPTELIPPYAFQSLYFDAGAPGGTRTPGLLLRRQLLYPAELLAHIQEPSENGAGEGNRTLVPSLEGWYSTIELHPQAMRAYHYPRRMSRVPERKTLKIRRGMEKFLSDQP